MFYIDVVNGGKRKVLEPRLGQARKGLPPTDGFDEQFQEAEGTRHQRSEPFEIRAPLLQCKVNCRKHASVSAEFRRWVWAGGRKLKGLMLRREAEAELYCRIGREACRGCGCSFDQPPHDKPPPRRGRPAIGRPRDRAYDGRPGGLRTGSPPSPPPRSICPAVRRLPRSPRLSGPGSHPSRSLPPIQRTIPPHGHDGGLTSIDIAFRDPAMASPPPPAHGRRRGPV